MSEHITQSDLDILRVANKVLLNNSPTASKVVSDLTDLIERQMLRAEKAETELATMELAVKKLRNDIVQVEGALDLATSMVDNTLYPWAAGMLCAIQSKITIKDTSKDDSFTSFLKQCSEQVKTWPRWKQDGADVTKFTSTKE